MTHYTVSQLKTAAYHAGFRGPNLVIAVAVSLAENGARDTNAIHHNSDGSSDYGAWQINSVHADLFATHTWNTLAGNAAMAYAVYQSQGWGAWTTYKSGAYRSNLGRAQKAHRINISGHGSVGPGAHGSGHGTSNTGSSLDWLYGAGWNVVQHDGSVTGALMGPLGSQAIGGTVSVAQFLGKLSDPTLWRRIGIGFAALVLLILGVVVMLASSKTTQKLAGKVLPV